MRAESMLFAGPRLSKPHQRTRQCRGSTTGELGICCYSRSLPVPMRSRHPLQTRLGLKLIFRASDCPISV
jgi:hypothetical protein